MNTEILDKAFESPPKSNSNNTYLLVSLVSYLIGVPWPIFENEFEPPKPEIFEQMEKNKNARIIRNLCMLRTAIERHFGPINNRMRTDYRDVFSMSEYIPIDCFKALSEDGVAIPKKAKLTHYIIEINRLISDRINNCRELLPIWINWKYLRDVFIMPNGLTEEGTKDAAEQYYRFKSYYPYQVYMNWPPADEGNILYHDRKFATLLYHWNNDYFTDLSKVSDVGESVKSSIYSFVEDSQKTVIVVDCENSNPYKLCATIRNLDAEILQKISKIILYDDVHAATAWKTLESYIEIPVEYLLVDRVKDNKSLVDIRLTSGVCKEFFQNEVDSFVLISSDSDYWGLITSLPDARFLVMVERGKCGFDMKTALFNAGIFFCYLDDFYSGNSNDIKVGTLVKHIYMQLASLNFNINEILNQAFRDTRIEMSTAEKEQFFNRYIKPMHLEIDEKGNVAIKLRRQ